MLIQSTSTLLLLGFLLGVMVAGIFVVSLFFVQRRKEESFREVSNRFAAYFSSIPESEAERARTSYYDMVGSTLVLRAYDPPDADSPDDVIPRTESSGLWRAIDDKAPVISTSAFGYSSTAAHDEEHESSSIWNFSVPVISTTGSVSGVITLDSDTALFEEDDIPTIFPAVPEGFRGLIIAPKTEVEEEDDDDDADPED